jgi:death on curing protein
VTQSVGLSLTDLLAIGEGVLGIDVERLARVIDTGRAQSALAAPFAGMGDVELYPDVVHKAAVLCSRVVRNHPFPDGNKRVAYFAMREMLARNDVAWPRPDADEVVDVMVRLAACDITEDEFAAWVVHHAS